MLEENGRSSVYVLSKAQSISDPLLPPSTHWVETLIPGVGAVWAEDMLCVTSCYGVISVCSLASDLPQGVGRWRPARFFLQGGREGTWSPSSDGRTTLSLGGGGGWWAGKMAPGAGNCVQWESEKHVWGMISEQRFYLSLKFVIYAHGFPRCDLVPLSQGRRLL